MSDLWDLIWSRDQLEWDDLSQEIYMTLKREIGSFQDKKILEAGSGSGRISLRLGLEGAQITLLDYSDKALEISQNLFAKYNVKASWVKADLTQPLPFDSDSFDIVWNAGVMEHFSTEEQLLITGRIYQISAQFHTFNPYAYSIPYRIGKWAAEKSHSWPYGQEYPVQSMISVLTQAGFETTKEYAIAPQVALDFFGFLGGYTDKLFRMFLDDLNEHDRQNMLNQLGGYLLYSQAIKPLGRAGTIPDHNHNNQSIE